MKHVWLVLLFLSGCASMTSQDRITACSAIGIGAVVASSIPPAGSAIAMMGSVAGCWYWVTK